MGWARGSIIYSSSIEIIDGFGVALVAASEGVLLNRNVDIHALGFAACPRRPLTGYYLMFTPSSFNLSLTCIRSAEEPVLTSCHAWN
jgi:hypothetical protein